MKEESNSKMDILVLGNSGCGKTTMVKALAGVENVLEEKKISIYESNVWPLRLIDTKGLETNLFDIFKRFLKVKKETNGKDIDVSEKGLEAVWLCVDGTSSVTFEKNINEMLKVIKGWKNIPVFVVITKSYSELERKVNVKLINKIFEDKKDTNFKKAIPVVALEYIINKDYTIVPFGLDDLCLETMNVFPECKKMNLNKKEKMQKVQLRCTAHASVVTASGIAATVAYLDKTNLGDLKVLVALEMGMTLLILKLYKIDYSEIIVKKLVGGDAISAVAKAIAGKFDPSQKVDAIVAGSVVFALGESVIAASEAISSGKLNIDHIQEYVTDKMKEYPIVNKISTFIENNKETLENANIEDLVKLLKKELTGGKTKKANA